MVFLSRTALAEGSRGIWVEFGRCHLWRTALAEGLCGIWVGFVEGYLRPEALAGRTCVACGVSFMGLFAARGVGVCN